MHSKLLLSFTLATLTCAGAADVRDSASLAQALRSAKPGDVIRVAPGNYTGGISASGIRGTEKAPVKLTASDPKQPPVIAGGASGLHLSGCSHVEISHLKFTGAKANGLNIDDGQQPGSSKGIVLRDLTVTGSGPEGNRDGIKLSGLDNFTVERCRVEAWGSSGSGIDMVGCHDGVVRFCVFERDAAGYARAMQSNGVQMKGGSARVSVQRCRFVRAGGRGVNLGGSTGADFMRPVNTDAEARDLTVEDCYFEGVMAPVAFVGVDQAKVSHNTIVNPGKWVMRILQENRGASFVPCRKGAFSDNIIVYQSGALGEAVNTGPGTEPSSFTFARNLWFCEDRPAASQRQIRLPVAEEDGRHGTDPKLDPVTGRSTLPQISAGIRPEKAVR
jgi:hypothetical protein